MKNIYFIIFTLFIFLQSSFSDNPSDTVAIVADDIISVYDLKKRIQLIINSQNDPVSFDKVEKIILASLQELIDEHILNKEAKKYHIIIKDNEITENMKKVAETNNMTEEKFVQILKEKHIDIESLKSQIKSQIIRSKLIENNILPKINVTDKEINETIETNPEADIELDFKKISINYIDQKDSVRTKNIVETLRSKIKTCENLEFFINEKFPEFRVEHINIKAKELPELIKNEISYTDLNKTTKIMHSGNNFQFYVVCGKEYLNLSTQEKQNISETLLHNKIMLQTNLYLGQLRKKTHIEIKEENVRSLSFSPTALNVR